MTGLARGIEAFIQPISTDKRRSFFEPRRIGSYSYAWRRNIWQRFAPTEDGQLVG
jgi:hypothetical protein